ncbi:MAG: hypothetical protein AABZ67_06945, partial [Pseudomonadota bacterium]
SAFRLPATPRRVNEKLAASPDDWLKNAQQHAGSWWTDWAQWAAKHGGGKVDARTPGKGKLKAIEDAPGAYVKVQTGAKRR